MRTFWLNFHADYACRRSGACCTSGWPIPVERDRVIRIQALAGRRADAWLVTAADAPEDVAGVLAVESNGHCVFHGAGGCGVYAGRPASCAHFPYVCLIDPRGVRVTLSHYCPTAAAMLFEQRGPIEVVEGPSPVREFETPEGLDARGSLPPAFAEASTSATATADEPAGKPNKAKLRLMSWDEFSAWEREMVSSARIDGWQPDDLAAFADARAAVPAPWSWPQAPAHADAIFHSLVAPAWPHFDDALARYAAAKVFASWSAYLGDGVEAVMRSARIAGAVLRVESARQCALAGRPLDRELLIEGIRQTDLLLVHLADQQRLISWTGRPRG